MDDTDATCGSPLLGRLTRDDEQLARAVAAHDRRDTRLETLPAQTASSTANAHQRAHGTWQNAEGRRILLVGSKGIKTVCLSVCLASYTPRLQPLQLRSTLAALTWLPPGSAHLFGG